MTKKLSTLVFIACLSSSLAFAGDKAKTKSSSDNASASTAEATSAQAGQNNANPAPKKSKKQDQRHVKPATPDQEEQLRTMQLEMYG